MENYFYEKAMVVGQRKLISSWDFFDVNEEVGNVILCGGGIYIRMT